MGGRRSLEPYRARRRAGRTPEPMPAEGETPPPGSGNRFVVQEHHATALHWDLRLERDGVLASWAVPKGLPLDPHQNHLAVHTEDHPLEYLTFSGEIPAGEYGGGTMSVWDEGTYECEKWSEREVMVVLHGGRVSGRYVLFRTSPGRRGARPAEEAHGGRDQWMIHRMDPAPDGWSALPEDVGPMLATAAEVAPEGPDWAYEMKWDGVRALVRVDGGRIHLASRRGEDVTVSYPELRPLGQVLGARPALLDGEIVAFDPQGRPSFSLLASRIHVSEGGRAARLASRTPVHLLLFDVLHLDGRATTDLPYDERRELLESLQLEGPTWATPPNYRDVAGRDVLAAASAQGLEGIVAKRRSARYLPGRRSSDWVKVKDFHTQEVVIGGWVPGKGRRSATLGALLLGVPDEAGLRYVGKVGTGFSDEALRSLQRQLEPLERAEPPFAGTLPRAQVAGARWVEPEVVGEVRYAEWTPDGRLRHPSWRGLREDKTPAEVRVEES